MKQEIAVVWQGNWCEGNHQFGVGWYHIVVASKELSPKKLPTLSCIDSDYDSAASYKGAILTDVNCEALRRQDIVSNQYICSKTVDQMQLALDWDIHSLSSLILARKIKGDGCKLSGFVSRSPDFSNVERHWHDIHFLVREVTHKPCLVDKCYPITCIKTGVSGGVQVRRKEVRDKGDRHGYIHLASKC